MQPCKGWSVVYTSYKSQNFRFFSLIEFIRSKLLYIFLCIRGHCQLLVTREASTEGGERFRVTA